MSKKRNLDSARRNKNDEIYTQMKDIEKELKHYTHHFQDKVIYCNADNYQRSNFYKYFKDNFQQFKIKKLIATCIKNEDGDYRICYSRILIKKKKIIN